MNKILILANAASGLYNFRIELVERLISEGYKVYFSVPEDLKNKRVELIKKTGAIHIQTYINRRGLDPFQEIKLVKSYKKIIKKITPDLILTYTVKPNIYGTYIASKFNKPVIMNITGIGSSLNNKGILGFIVQRLYKYACRKASFIFFQNESNHLFFLSNHFVEKNRIKIIPGSGVNIDKFYPMQKRKADHYLRFLFIGRMMKEKGIDEFFQSAEKVIKEYDNVEFCLLGSFEEKRYKQIIKDNKNSKIKYLGTSNDVRAQISEADCIVNPSYHEGMSNVLLEGAAMGKPLIASNIPGCKEIIKDGYNGYLFEPKSVVSLTEKLIQFINLDEKARECMGENSRKKVVTEFDRTIVVNEYMEVIKLFLNKDLS